MATITQIKNKVVLAINGIEPTTAKIVSDNEEKILNYVRNDQLSKGEDSEGNPITAGGNYDGVYSYSYTSQNLGGWGDNSAPITTKTAGNPYNFTWSGYTMANFRTEYSNFSLFILNTGNSASYLTSFYKNGNKLFEMSEQNEQRMRGEIFIPELRKYLKSIFR